VLRDVEHALERDTGPVLLIFRHGDQIHDAALDEVLHRPAEMRRVDSEHRGTLADGRRKEEDLLIGLALLQAIDEIQLRPNAPDRSGLCG
jgi:hypothetical protein